MPTQPNVVFVFGDQWRAQATGYAGDPNVRTPHLDALAARSVNFTTAVSPSPVCTPARASLLTGQYPLTHGLFINDVHLDENVPSIAKCFAAAGYDTGYIGKWHVNANGRLAYIPREFRQGFDHWLVCECTHKYFGSLYYAGDDPTPRKWPGYDAFAQTDAACDYIRGAGRDAGRPFLLMLSWGPPHNPYQDAPREFLDLYDPAAIALRPNVPPEDAARARKDLAGYYAHCSALDTCVGRLLATLDDAGLADDTIFVFSSDHGDMLGSQGQQRKQRPWDESILVPLLMRAPRLLGRDGRAVDMPFTWCDLMPTLLGLAGIDIPDSVEGTDYSGWLIGRSELEVPAALVACHSPFGEFLRGKGGREYRGLRTRTHTYVRDLSGPWLLYDNAADPYQQANLVGSLGHAELQSRLDAMLTDMLRARGDEFLSGWTYIARRGYTVDATGTAPYGDWPG
ncbi:MAG: Arylsulfatase [Phycisphaerae bacterium]|nr:Arylsulfatase [Phycisphaerae bacterium]